MNRRHAIALALGGGVAANQGCSRRRVEDSPSTGEGADEATGDSVRQEGHGLVPAAVDPGMVIRTLTGLRPFRPSGFVVRRDEIGGKTIVHNYGHGGGGITLSWGSAHLAIQLARPVAGLACAVVGGGVMGLSTARLLQLQGARVSLHTRELPPETTSNVAGAQCWPVSVYHNRNRTEAFGRQYVEAARFSFDYFQRLVGPRWGVRWLPNYYLSANPHANGWMSGPGGVLHAMQIGFRDFGPGEHVFPSPHVRRFHTMLIEPSTYLATLLRDVQAAGARIEIRDFAGSADILGLPESTIFNCSGLGAKRLFGDEELVPVKGQLEVLLPQPALNYNLITDEFYMFPRGDGVILGGSYQRGNWDLAPDPEISRRILQGQQSLFAEMQRLQDGGILDEVPGKNGD